MPATFAYWKLRGLGQYIRFLLEYTGEDYVEKRYEFGPPPEYNTNQWLNDKFKLGLDFPNLPYYIDGDIKLTQSIAILRHIARKHNLLPETDVQIAKSSMLENEAMDLLMSFGRVCYDPNFESLKSKYIKETIEPKLTQLSKFLGSSDWFLGSNISYVDFILYEAIYCFHVLSPASFDNFESLKKYMQRMENLEPIKKYINSDRYIKYPLNGPTATYGGI